MNDLSERISILVRQGQKVEARGLLAGILQQDPTNVHAWSMMAELADDSQQEAICLHRILGLAEDIHLREWAAMRLARLETPEQQKESPAVISDSPIPAQVSDSDDSNHTETALLVILNIVLVLGIIGLIIMIGYWLLPQIEPQLGSLPFRPSNTPAAMATNTLMPTSTQFSGGTEQTPVQSPQVTPTLVATSISLVTPTSTTPIPTVTQSDDASFDLINMPHDSTIKPVWDGENLFVDQVGVYHAELTLDRVTLVFLDENGLFAAMSSWLMALRHGEVRLDMPAPDPMIDNPSAMNGWLVQDNILLRQRATGIYEVVVARAEDIELAYLLTAPPVAGAQGDVELINGLDTVLDMVADEKGVYLINARGDGIFIGQSTVTDANGSTAPVVIRPDAEGFALVISQDWLAQATYPILIDPPLIYKESLGS